MSFLTPVHDLHFSKRIRTVLAWGLFVLSLSFAGVYVNSGRFVARQVYFQNQSVEGLTREQARAVVQIRIEQIKKQDLEIAAELRNIKVTPRELGIDFDVEKTVDQFFVVSRSLWLKAQILSAATLASKEYHVQPVLEADPEQVESAVQERLSISERPVQNASIAWSNSEWRIESAIEGRKVAQGEAERIAQAILNDVYELHDKEAYYEVKIERIFPQIQAAHLARMLELVRQLSQNPVTIQVGGVTEVIAISLEAGQWFIFDYPNRTVDVNQNQAASLVANFAARYDREPTRVVVKGVKEVESEYAKNETYKKAVIEGNFHSGRRLKQELFIQQLTSVLAQPGERKVEVTFTALPPEIISQVAGLAFPHRLSVGESSYHLGNKPNRVHNIKRALELEDLTIIDQGDLFSYNKVLGWVSYEKGFVDGQVIFGDSLANVPGGGVCQTSTTMFRAAVKAGLPIVERSNHSWDVHYYQDWHGVDAAVYPPGRLDLIFKNDTPGPILVHSYTDNENEMAYFELYGTSDGRTVEFETIQNVRQGAGRRIVTDWKLSFANGMIEKRQIISHYRR